MNFRLSSLSGNSPILCRVWYLCWDRPIVKDFSLAEGDSINLSDVLSGFDPLTDILSDWAEITDSGTGSILSIDQDGLGTQFAMTQIAVLDGITGLGDEDALVAAGNLIAA